MARLTRLSNRIVRMRILAILRSGGACVRCDGRRIMSCNNRRTKQVKQTQIPTQVQTRGGRYGGRDRRAYSSKYRHDGQDIEGRGRDSSSATPGRTTELSELTWNLAGNEYEYASNRPHPQHSAAVRHCYRRTCRCGRTFLPP